MHPTDTSILRFHLNHGQGVTGGLGSRFYMDFSGGRPTIADCVALATDCSNSWAAHLASLMATIGGLLSVTATDVTDSTGFEGTYTHTQPGTRSGNPPDYSACAQINFKIGRGYKGGKPKIFLPFGITTDLASGQEWNTTFTNAVDAGWTAFIAALTGATSGTTVVGVQRNVSYFSGHTPNSDTSIWAPRNMPNPRATAKTDPMVAHATRLTIGSQRRRLTA